MVGATPHNDIALPENRSRAFYTAIKTSIMPTPLPFSKYPITNQANTTASVYSSDLSLIANLIKPHETVTCTDPMSDYRRRFSYRAVFLRSTKHE